MMKFGVNLLLFSDTITPAVLRQFPRLRDLGFDGVEVPVFAPHKVRVDEIRAQAEKCGLKTTTSGALPPGARFYGKGKMARRKAEKYLMGCIRVMQALDAPLMCGPLYKTVGDMDESIPLAKQRQQAARAMRPLCRAAEEVGKVFALEPINRFETNFMNTVAQGIAFCRQLDSPAAGLLLDTFHMHIEEKHSAKAIQAAANAGVFAHFHASENDRGVAGSGQVAWKKVGKAVRRPQYKQWCVLESFSQTVEAIRTAVSCWRPFYGSTGEFCKAGLAFAKKTFGKKKR